MEDSLKDLVQSSLDRYSGTDVNHIFGVPAASERRRNTVRRVLDEARRIISEEGIASLTFRKLSHNCGMMVSNIQYYFPSSDEIIRSLMRFIITEYLDKILDGSFLEVSNPEHRLIKFLESQVEDVQERRTNTIFLALWDLSQRDAFVSKLLGEIYSVERSIIMLMLSEIHPLEDQSELSDRSAVIASLIEGMMPLFGPAAQPGTDLGNVHRAAVRFSCQIAGIEPPA